MKRRGLVHSCLEFVVLIITLAGCGGAQVIPIGERVRNADRQFDAAEAFRIQADKDTEQDKRREQVQQKKALYDKVLNAYRLIVKAKPTVKYAQRSLWQISEIYSRRYEWGKVIENYYAIIAIDPSSYYSDRAKSGIADMSTYRRLIEEAQRKYQEYNALYAQNEAGKLRYGGSGVVDVAESYERLGDYPEAISYYQRMVDEFPKHEKAPTALTKIGEIHFYKLYDYLGGWPAYNTVIEMYPDSYDATKAIRLLKETDRTLTEIAQNQAEIRRYRSKKAIEYEQSERKLMPSERYGVRYVDIVVQCFQFIGRRWEDLRNYPSAIVAYRTLVDKRPHKKFAAADARYQIGRLNQLNGQLNQAIEAYQDLFDNNPESTWRAEGIYQQAVCNRGIREFAKAYEEFKAYMNLGRDVEYYQEAEQIIRELETDKDGDRYEFDIEQGVGTSKLRSQQTSGCEFFIGPNFPRKSRELTPGSLAISASQSLD